MQAVMGTKRRHRGTREVMASEDRVAGSLGDCALQATINVWGDRGKHRMPRLSTLSKVPPQTVPEWQSISTTMMALTIMPYAQLRP